MDVTRSSVSLVWTRPKHDGGSKLIGYFVEYCKLPEEKWSRCNSNCMSVQAENYVVSGLEEGQRYVFRVIAKTAVNVSLPSELSDPIAVIAENGRTPLGSAELSLRTTAAVTKCCTSLENDTGDTKQQSQCNECNHENRLDAARAETPAVLKAKE